MLFLILGGIFVYRTLILVNTSHVFFSDDAIYASLARSLIEGDWQSLFHPTWPPLFPFLSALLYLLFHNWEFTLRFVSILAGVLTLIPLYYLVKYSLSFAPALFFVLFIGFFIPLIDISLLPLSDSLSIFLIICGLTATYFAIEFQKPFFYFLGAFSFGLAYLTRSEGLIFFTLTLIFIFAYFLSLFLKGRRYFKYSLSVIILFAVTFFITISPYVIAMREKFGYWTISPKASAFVYRGHAFALRGNGLTWAQEVTSARSPNYTSEYFKNGNRYFLERLYYFTGMFDDRLSAWKVNLSNHIPSWSPIFVLLGFLKIIGKKLSLGNFYIASVGLTAAFFIVFSTDVAEIRYLGWFIIILLYFYYLGIDNFVTILKRKFNLSLYIIPLVLLSSIFFYPVDYWSNLLRPLEVYAKKYNRDHDEQVLIKAGVWIKEHSKFKKPKIMMRHEGVEFYAGGETIYLPQVSYEGVLRYAKKQQADYLIAWDKELSADFELMSLLNFEDPHQGLKKELVLEDKSSRLVIYRVVLGDEK